jgi:zona occludens toxin (predicted ATPase)
MLEAFTGAQRSGKTYSAVQRVLDVYLNSDRPIYTNLPLTEHFLAMRPERAPDVYFFYRSFRDVVNVAKRTRTFFRGVGFAFLDKTFFNRTGSNAFVVVDEAYEIFNFGRSKDFSPDNEKLLSYLKQHGHYGDDIIIISHDLRDVERIIRTSFQRITRVFNTKYTPIYDRFPLNLIRTPFQCFCHDVDVEGIVSRHFVWPKEEGFLMYDSFCSSGNVKKATARTSDLDRKLPWKKYLLIVCVVFFIILFFTLFLARKALNPDLSAFSAGKGGNTSESVPAASLPVMNPLAPLIAPQWAVLPGEKRSAAGVMDSVPLPPPRKVTIEFVVIETSFNKGLELGIDIDAVMTYALSWEALSAAQFNPIQSLAIALTAKTKIDADSLDSSIITRTSLAHTIGTTSALTLSNDVKQTTFTYNEAGTAYTSGYTTDRAGTFLTLSSRDQDGKAFVLDVKYTSSQRLSDSETYSVDFSYTIPVVRNETIPTVSYERGEKSVAYEKGIPLLSDIPWLGYVFRISKERRIQQRRSAVVIIH